MPDPDKLFFHCKVIRRCQVRFGTVQPLQVSGRNAAFYKPGFREQLFPLHDIRPLGSINDQNYTKEQNYHERENQPAVDGADHKGNQFQTSLHFRQDNLRLSILLTQTISIKYIDSQSHSIRGV